jgi:hypothetical protein
MSTQFFHPHLIPHLVHNAGLFDMLVNTAYKVLRSAFLVRTPWLLLFVGRQCCLGHSLGVTLSGGTPAR